MADVHMLTTTDNPYNPFTHWDEWLAFDTEKGYHTPGILARIAITSDELPDELEGAAIEEAIDEIVQINALGLYRKITKDSTDMIRSFAIDSTTESSNSSEPADPTDPHMSMDPSSEAASTAS